MAHGGLLRSITGALLAVVAFVVACIAAPASAYAAYSYDGPVDTSWYTDNPDAAEFYLDDAADLAGLAKLVYSGTDDTIYSSENHVTFKGKTIHLRHDVNLSGYNWFPIGNPIASPGGQIYFGGTFDGEGHTISGMTISDDKIENSYQGLYGLAKGATIQNFTITGQITAQLSAASVCSQAVNTSFKNITSDVDIAESGYATGAGIGGIVAYSFNNQNVSFEGLVNKGNVTSRAYYTGGVIGFLYTDYGTTASVSKCANVGDVTVKNSANVDDVLNRSAGGLIGSTGVTQSGTQLLSGTYAIDQSYNTGSVTSSNLLSVGGISGYLGGEYSSITNSYNTGSVTANGGTAAGILGTLDTYGGFVSNTYSYANLTGANGAGGILGKVGADNNEAATAHNYYLSGEASSMAADGSYGTDNAAKTDDELRSYDILALLNSSRADLFGIDPEVNGGLPAFTQNKLTPGIGTGTGTGDDGKGTGAGGDDPNNAGSGTGENTHVSGGDMNQTANSGISAGEDFLSQDNVAFQAITAVESAAPQASANAADATNASDLADAADAAAADEAASAAESADGDVAGDVDTNAVQEGSEGAPATFQMLQQVTETPLDDQEYVAPEDLPWWFSLVCGIVFAALAVVGAVREYTSFRANTSSGKYPVHMAG